MQALRAGEDYDLWDASGAGPFVQRLIATIDKLTDIAKRTSEPLYNLPNGQPIPAHVAPTVIPRRVMRTRTEQDEATQRPPAPQQEAVPETPAEPSVEPPAEPIIRSH